MKLFREENIEALYEAISGDEFEDLAQIDTRGDIDRESFDFVKRNVKGKILECGPGSGRLIEHMRIDAFLEPSAHMLQRLKERVMIENYPGVEPDRVVQQGVIECIPFGAGMFDTVIFMNGFFQVRSDYEAMIEVNRTLRLGGRFIFNLYTDDSEDIICGRVLGLDNYIRILGEFGFGLVEKRPEIGHICVEKLRDFDLRELRKLQFVKAGDTWRINNLIEDGRDATKL